MNGSDLESVSTEGAITFGSTKNSQHLVDKVVTTCSALINL